MDRTKIFLSYSHEDERWRKRVAGHLAVLSVEGILDPWDDRRIGAGQDWFAEISEQMREARIAVLLISSAFLTSRFIREEEVPRLFERHARGGMTIYPLLIKPCPWQEVGWLARLQVRPADARPLASYRGSRVDEVLVEVAREISALAQSDAAPNIEKPAAPAGSLPDIGGAWKAEVAYGARKAPQTETFRFTVDGDAVFGTASYLGVKRAIFDGAWNNGRLTFLTRTQEVLDDWNNPRQVVHRYRGRLSGNEIAFILQTEGGYSESPPVEFTATRMPDDAAGG